MTYADIQRRIWSNALSNYLRTLVGIVVGLLTFRLLYQHFNKESFGFWSLLWSVFGYGILLDFGFGFAAQKRVAELSVSKDWPQLSRVLSTILFFYLGVALLLAGAVTMGSHAIIRLFEVSPAHHDEFRVVLIVFFAAIGMAFPLGIFPEFLRGQQRISLANNITTIAMLLPATYALPPVAALIMLAGIYYGAQYGGSTTAILVNLPGESSSVVTVIDGYQMARKGRAGPALAAAGLGDANTFTKAQVVTPVALTAGATVNIDASLSNNFTLTPNQNFTLAAPTNPTNGQVINVVFTQGGTPYTITFNAAWQFAGGVEPALTAAANAVDFMSCYYNGATSKWICVMNLDFKA